MNERLEREAYLNERRALIDVEVDQARQFDRTILVLSSAALGLSLTFIREAVPVIDETTLRWVITGWGLLIGSIFLTLLSFQVSQSALRRHREILDYLQTPGADRDEDPTKTTKTFATAIYYFNVFSFLFFVAGTICLTTFVALNMFSEG